MDEFELNTANCGPDKKVYNIVSNCLKRPACSRIDVNVMKVSLRDGQAVCRESKISRHAFHVKGINKLI